MTYALNPVRERYAVIERAGLCRYMVQFCGGDGIGTEQPVLGLARARRRARAWVYGKKPRQVVEVVGVPPPPPPPCE